MRRVLGLAVVLGLTACDMFGGGGGGGGGGPTAISFASGFTYVRKDDRNVYVADDADLQTTGVLTTATTASTPALSADGKRIVFVRKTATGTELALVPAGGGTASTLLSSTTTIKNLKTPSFSPDGAKVVFAFDEGGGTSVGLVNVDGSGFVKIIGGGSLAYSMPSFLPDGQSVITAAGSPGLAYTQLEKVDVTTAVATSVTNSLGNEAQAIINRVVVSPDGTKAAFDGRTSTGVTRIFVIDLSTKTVTKANDYTNEPGTNDTWPSWMTADTLAFGSDSGGSDNVYKVKVDATGRKLLLPSALEAFYGPAKTTP